MAQDKREMFGDDNAPVMVQELNEVKTVNVYYQLSVVDMQGLFLKAGLTELEMHNLMANERLVAVINTAFNEGVRLNTTAINEMLVNTVKE